MKPTIRAAAAAMLGLSLAAITFTGAVAETAATAATATTGPITITEAYARSTNPSAGAAFMTIANSGASDCVLAAVTTPVSPRAELHTHREEAGVMKMLRIDTITVPAGGSHALQRGGDHVMFLDTPQPITEGQALSMTLDFGECGTVPLTVPVDNKAGMQMMHGKTGMQDGHDAGHGMAHGHEMSHGAAASN